MKYRELIQSMTLEEKAMLMSGKNNWESEDIPRLKVPSLFCADGPHGIRKQLGAADHLGLNPSAPATCYPTASAIANSWDTSLGEDVGSCLGAEAAEQGVNILLGPGLNIKRNPLCGRNFEYFSEDPYLSGKMAAGYVRGIQSHGVSACPKHFAANSQETLRMASDSVMDERTLRELYLTGFEIAVKESNPKTLMTSYNLVNGVYANENPHLLQEILVDEWGFDGIVVSDWGGSNDHTAGVAAGNHLEMPAAGPGTDREIVEAVKNGSLSMEILDKRVDEFLSVLFDVTRAKNVKADLTAHHAAARRAARESIVLLKNENSILPLKKGASVAVIGDFADMPRYQGAGSSLVNTTHLDRTMDEIKKTDLTVAGFSAGFTRNGTPDDAMLKDACALAQKAETVLLYLGLDEVRETEGLDRSDMRIAENQVALLAAIQKANPNIVVVLSCGSAVEMPWLGHCRALIHASLSGQAGAGAILDVLTGVYNPSGKLTESYPVKYQDTPNYRYYPGLECSAEYREGPFVGYRYYEKANIPVQFPFGFGLSYSTFSYSELSVSATEVSFTLENTGALAGAEVVQLYIGKNDSAVFRPVKELKGFQKVFLQSGERKAVTIPLDDKAFRYFDVTANRFETESGEYQIYVGSSSADIRLTGEVAVKGTAVPSAYDSEKLPHYFSGKVTEVSDKEFELLLGRPLPNGKWDRSKPLGRNDTFAQLFYAKSPVARLAYKVLSSKKRKAEESGKPDLNILFIYNMPFRGMAKMMGGMFDMKMVDALLFLFNGHFFRGAGRLIKAFLTREKPHKS